MTGRAQGFWPGPVTFIAAAVGIPAALSAIDGFDLFFYLSTGDDLLAHGFPTVDPFSPNVAGVWFPSEWLFCVATSASVELFGGYGPGLLGAILLSAEVWVLWFALRWAAEGRWGTALVALLLVLQVQWYAWDEPRAFYVGHLCFALVTWAALRWEDGARRWLWGAPLLGLLWANAHGSFLLLPVTALAMGAGALLDGRPWKQVRGLGAAAVVGTLVSVVSPGGLETLIHPLRLMGGIGEADIAEWGPLVMDRGGYAFVLGVLVTAGLVLRAEERKARWWLPALGLALASFWTGRHAPFAAMWIAMTALRHVPWDPDRFADSPLPAAFWRWTRNDRPMWTVLSLVGVVLYAGISPVALEDHIDRRVHPVSAVAALEDSPPGRVLAFYRFGALVSALAGPAFPVFIDGRTDAYPAEVHEAYRKLALAKPGWESAVADFDPSYVLWSREGYGKNLADVLDARPDWVVVHEAPAGTLWRHVPVR